MSPPNLPLLRRLEALKRHSTLQGDSPTPPGRIPQEKPTPSEKIPPPLPGWKEEAPLLYRRTSVVAVPSPPPPEESLVLRGLYPGVSWGEAGKEDYRFFDLETTGLSGGSGNIAFLAGVGRFEGGSCRITQLFLADYPGEPAFLDALAELLPPESVWVSYNGRTFDTPLMRTRFLMNRRTLNEGLPLDILHPARRLWKRILPDCSLGTIEKEILLKERRLDIPGAEIPLRYFSYLKNRRPGPMEPVAAHHREDIISLTRLFPLMESILSGGEPGVPRDPLGVGILLLPLDPEAAEKALQEGAARGDTPCSLALGIHLKRTGRAEEAFTVWNSLWHLNHNLRAARELAIHWEHHRREPARALEIVETVLGGSLPFRKELQEDWEYRRQRLVRKTGAEGGNSGKTFPDGFIHRP